MPRLFTREEAEALLPQLIPLVTRMQELKRQHDTLSRTAAELNARTKGNGHAGAGQLQVAAQRMESTANQLNAVIDEIRTTGCEVKDLDMGLLDFRTEMDGREVFLCWKAGEPRIDWWHELDTGFATRQRIESGD